MGILDTLKAKLSKEKVADLAQKHGDRIDQGLDSVARTVDEKTKGKYRDQIRAGTSKAKDAMDRLAGPSGRDGSQNGGGSQDGGGDTSPAPPSAP
ncbi:antitoxin [Streptomyces sp. NPDC058067]|uniref:antitoxin n=1 Tax=Streptomyces sp. NPDC058067 TaxID=3346324 RepID=UPI0036E53DA8